MAGVASTTTQFLLVVQTSAGKRQRIARDLHDGVGFQIVHILSTPDIQAPQQRPLALALKQCLFNLKITIDAIGHCSDSVTDVLGHSRYRVQLIFRLSKVKTAVIHRRPVPAGAPQWA